jgi:hypothetical protein
MIYLMMKTTHDDNYFHAAYPHGSHRETWSKEKVESLQEILKMILDVVAGHPLIHFAYPHEFHLATCCRVKVGYYLHHPKTYWRETLAVVAVDNDEECGDESDLLHHHFHGNPPHHHFLRYYVNVELIEFLPVI